MEKLTNAQQYASQSGLGTGDRTPDYLPYLGPDAVAVDTSYGIVFELDSFDDFAARPAVGGCYARFVRNDPRTGQRRGREMYLAPGVFTGLDNGTMSAWTGVQFRCIAGTDTVEFFGNCKG